MRHKYILLGILGILKLITTPEYDIPEMLENWHHSDGCFALEDSRYIALDVEHATKKRHVLQGDS